MPSSVFKLLVIKMEAISITKSSIESDRHAGSVSIIFVGASAKPESSDIESRWPIA